MTKQEIFEKTIQTMLDDLRTTTTKDKIFFIIFDSYEQSENFIKLLTQGNNYDFSDLFEYGFSDEYTTCHSCNNLIEFSNFLTYYIDDCQILCKDCLNLPEIIDKYINNSKTAIVCATEEEIKALGYKLVNEYPYTGGMNGNDEPEQILKKQLEIDPNGKYIFHIIIAHAFFTDFNLFKKEE